MPNPGREAYRAIYLASPLKFCTTLHAFTRVLPRYHIDPWQKDPQAAEKHKWHTSQTRKRGRWFYRNGPLAGVRLEGWPEPGLLGSGELVQVASRAQSEGLQDGSFWLQVAERAYKLRDVMRVGDLAVILDALVTANYRHTQLMKTLTREFIDDVEKMSLVELAVVANAYAHFNCVSEPMLRAFAQHTTRLLSGADCGPYLPLGGDVASDPQSLGVLAKAFATLQHADAELFKAVNGAAVQHADGLPFPTLAELWVSFAKLNQPFKADEHFWSSTVGKVSGSRMASLCPALRASALLKFRQPELREALVSEILLGLKEAPTTAPSLPLGAALGLWQSSEEEASPRPSLPAFATEQPPRSLLTALLPGPHSSTSPPAVASSSHREAGHAAAGQVAAEDSEAVVVEWEDAPLAGEADPATVAEPPASAPGRGRFYNAVSRRLSRAARPSYLEFDTSEHFARNRRGSFVAEALEGLNILWKEGPQAPRAAAGGSQADGGGQAAGSAQDAAGGAGAAAEPLAPLAMPPAEAALIDAAAPVLRGALQGLAAPQLAACAEAYAFHALHTGAPPDPAVFQDVVREAVRKLSNFGTADLRRLHEACLQLGVSDPYLERARQKRFPKALQLEMKGAASPGAVD